MRVLYVGPAHTPFVRESLAPLLGGVEAALVSTTRPPAEFLAAHPGLRFELLPRPAFRALPRRLFLHTVDYAVELWDLLLRRFRPDLLHVFYASQLDALALAPLTMLPRGRGVPLVLTVMGADVLEEQVPRPWPLDRLLRRLMRRAGAVTAKSRFLAGRCVALGARPDAVHLVPWGLPRGAFLPAAPGPARAALGLPPHERLLLSPRSLHALYNHAPLLEAVARLAPGPPLRVVFSRAAEDPAHARALEARARALGVAASFLPGLPPEHMTRLYAAADAVASLPASDGLPQTLLEALACGRPALGLDLPAYRELPFGGDAFVRVAHQGGRPVPAALEQGLAALLAPGPRPGLDAARAWIAERLDLDDSLATVRALYRVLTSG